MHFIIISRSILEFFKEIVTVSVEILNVIMTKSDEGNYTE